MFLSVIWYLGGALVVIGGLCVLRPVRWLGLPTRKRAALAALAGVVLSQATLFVGTSTRRIETPSSLIDGVIPAFEFNEHHSIRIAAPADRVYKAVFEVTADEIAGYRTLTWMRCFGRCPEGNLMNPAAHAPLLATALSSGFRKLAETPNEELVFGTLVAAPAGAARREWTLEAFVALAEPGYAKAVMNFRLQPAGGGVTILDTETRVHATDPATVRAFATYWRTILPGSALIRVAWLRAIKRRAEG